MTLLAVAPMIPAIHRDLALDETAVSVLTGLPVLLLAIAAIPGALLIARVGARRALVAGMLVVGTASALRGVGPSLTALFAMTAVMGTGVAVSQPAFPTLVGEWFPARVGLATAVYSNGLLVGETLPAAFTGPLVAPHLGGSWPLVFAFWSLPALAAAALLGTLTPHDGGTQTALDLRRWWPDFGDGNMWRLGLVMGMASAAYWATNAFIPDFVHATARAGLKDAGLTAINTCQLAASLLVVAMSRHLTRRRWPFAAVGGLIAAGALAVVLAPGAWLITGAALIGFASALALVLTLALPPLLVSADDVPRFSAGILLITYATSFLGPVLGGAAWDATGRPAAPFLAVAAGGALMVVLVATGRDMLQRRDCPDG